MMRRDLPLYQRMHLAYEAGYRDALRSREPRS